MKIKWLIWLFHWFIRMIMKMMNQFRKWCTLFPDTSMYDWILSVWGLLGFGGFGGIRVPWNVQAERHGIVQQKCQYVHLCSPNPTTRRWTWRKKSSVLLEPALSMDFNGKSTTPMLIKHNNGSFTWFLSRCFDTFQQHFRSHSL